MRPIVRYRAWALREPFVLDVGDDLLEVPFPGADTLLRYASARTPRDRMVVLGGASAPALLEVVGPLPAGVVALLADDMAQAFGCTEAARLVSLLDRYGDPIAADLNETYQIDMLAVFTGDMLPDQVLSRIDQLPRHSRMSEAIAQDDELAELMADTPVGSAVAIKFTEYTPEVERLTVIVNSLGAIFSAIAAIAGSNAQLPQLHGPVGAADRFKERQIQQEFDDIVADVTRAHQLWKSQTEPEEG